MIIAMSAASPMIEGKETGFKETRALTWIAGTTAERSAPSPSWADDDNFGQII